MVRHLPEKTSADQKQRTLRHSLLVEPNSRLQTLFRLRPYRYGSVTGESTGRLQAKQCLILIQKRSDGNDITVDLLFHFFQTVEFDHAADMHVDFQSDRLVIQILCKIQQECLD